MTTNSPSQLETDNRFVLKFQGWVQGKTRIATAWIFAILLAISAKNLPAIEGTVFCFLGACLRYWASGYLRKDSRPAVGGPYAFVRNPLYLGTYFMAIGTAWSIHAYGLLIVITVVFGAIYHFIIKKEEEKLDTIFGEPYFQYKKLVPRFIPYSIAALTETGKRQLRAINPDPEAHHFSKALAKKNKAFEAFASFAGLIGGCAVISILWSYFQK